MILGSLAKSFFGFDGKPGRTKNVFAGAPSTCGCAVCYLRRRLKPTLLKGKPIGLESAAMSDDLQESVPVVVLNRALFGVGLLLYVLSFFLVATRDSKGGLFGRMVGYECAYLAPEYVIAGTPFSHGDAYVPPLPYLAILVAGLINPVFLVYVTLAFLGRKPRAMNVLRYVLVAMIPFSWLAFPFFELYPREGHFVWVAGMLLVLFSKWKQSHARLA